MNSPYPRDMQKLLSYDEKEVDKFLLILLYEPTLQNLEENNQATLIGRI